MLAVQFVTLAIVLSLATRLAGVDLWERYR